MSRCWQTVLAVREPTDTDCSRRVVSIAAGYATNCPTPNICYSLAIPDSTAQSGSGDIFFSVTAPDNLQWVALGQGQGMNGANMFVFYQSGDGTNVTISPRAGVGRVQPRLNRNPQLTLLAGSGVFGGKMTANVKCKDPLPTRQNPESARQV